MLKLHIINHELMPKDMTCELNLTKDGYHSYLMESKENAFFYEIIIRPFRYGSMEYSDEQSEIVLSREESLESLIFTHAEYFSIKLKDLNGKEVECLYERRKEVPLYYLN